jgi:MerR family transcriptional regulator, copper efflux regulator
MCARAATELADAEERGCHSIGRAAELSGVTAKMIRRYESLDLIRRARGLGFAIDEIGSLLSLWQNERRASKEVKRLALKHVAELDSKIEELQSMRGVLADLAAHCRGDARPECPILDDLGGLPPSE